MVTEHDMATREGDLIRVLELQAVPFETAMPVSIEGTHDIWANYIAMQGALADCMFHVVRWQFFDSDRLDPVREDTYAKVIDNKLAERLAQRRGLSNRVFLVLLYRPPEVTNGGDLATQIRQRRQQALEEMEQRTGAALRALRDFKPRLLGNRRHQGRDYSEVAEFAGLLVNGRMSPVRAGEGPLYRRLPAVRMSVNAAVVEFQGIESSRFAVMLDIQDYGEGIVEPGFLNPLLYEPVEFIETQSFEPYTTRKALRTLQLQQRQLISTNDASETQIAAMNTARDEVRSGLLRFGRYYYSLAAFGDTAQAALRAAARIQATFAENGGITLALVDLLADDAWLAQMPGNHRHRPRRADLSHRAFCALASCHGFYRGKRDGNPWGQALMVLRGRSGRLVYVNLHASPQDENNEGEKYPGTSVITGVNGSGKTTLEAVWLMLSRHWYPAPAIVVLDKDRGLEIALRAMGGTYVRLAFGIPTGINPFQWERTTRHAKAQVEILKAMVYVPELPLLPSELMDLENAVLANERLPDDQRGVTAIWQRLPVDGPRGTELSLKKRLYRWTAGQPNGWVFDEEPDSLPHNAGGVTGFDYTEFLELPEIRTPVAMALLQFAEDRIDGARVMVVMAEAWKVVADPAMGGFAHNKAKTIRKQNGLCIFDTQEPDDLANDVVGDTLISQAATVICFADEKATEAAYCARLRLTPAELQIVRTLRQHGSRCFLFKQGLESAIVEFDLSGMDEAIWVLSGSLDNVQLLDAVRDEVGDDPDDWLPVLFQRIRERKARNHALVTAAREASPAL
jgi:type IV secretion system protein VirB4